jgi:hypothetical protein
MRKIKLRGFEIRVYANKPSMQKAWTRYTGDKTNVHGAVCPHVKFTFNGKKFVKDAHDLGVVFLYEHSPIEVVIHEMLHCATSYLRNKKHKLNLGSRISKTEESLAWVQTAFVADLVPLLYKNIPVKFRNVDLNYVLKQL